MDTIQLKDKRFKLNISSHDIQKRVKVLAESIAVDYQAKLPLFVVVLNGAFMFASDLLKYALIDCEVSFVKLSSYEGTHTTGKVREIIGLQQNIEGREVIVVEDIVDTGITMDNLLRDLRTMNPKEIKIATLLFKPASFHKNFPIDYIGFEIPNDFIVGYGLDYDQIGRNLSDIYIITD
jgi:hypoxanthine phosphoribosyltransferase